MEGYFKVHRKILDSQVFAHQTALKIWIWCLAKVTFKDRFISLKIGKGETTVNLKPGQFIFGRFKAEEELGIDGSTIYRWMQKFSSPEYDMILIESNNQYSIVTICNWQQYQNIEDTERTTNEQPTDNQRAANEQPTNTNNNDKESKESKEDIFKQSVLNFDSEKYSPELCEAFISYWTEKNSKGKMRYEAEKFFDISRRLATWKRNDEKNNKKVGYERHSFSPEDFR